MEKTTVVESTFESDGKSYLIKFELTETPMKNEMVFEAGNMRLFALNDNGQWEPRMLNGFLPIESTDAFRA